jgi:hypothetical protein
MNWRAWVVEAKGKAGTWEPFEVARTRASARWIAAYVTRNGYTTRVRQYVRVE